MKCNERSSQTSGAIIQGVSDGDTPLRNSLDGFTLSNEEGKLT